MSIDQTSPVPPPPEAPNPEITGVMPGVMPGAYPQQAQQPYGYPPYQQAYQPQPQWGGQPQYMPMPPAPKQPSILTDPKALVDKLPLAALIVLIGGGAAGLFSLISSFLAGGFLGYYVLSYIGSFLLDCAIGVLGFALLMTLKHFLDIKQAEADAAAAAVEEQQ